SQSRTRPPVTTGGDFRSRVRTSCQRPRPRSPSTTEGPNRSTSRSSRPSARRPMCQVYVFIVSFLCAVSRRMGHSRVGFAAGLPRLRFGWWLGRLINLAGGDEVVVDLPADLPATDGVLAIVILGVGLRRPKDAVSGVVEPEVGASAGSSFCGR